MRSSCGRRARPPGGRDGERVRRHAVRAATVAADDVERAAGEIGDAAAGRHRALDRPARQRDGAGAPGTRQRTWPSATCTATRPEPDASTAFVPCGEIAVARGAERAHAPAGVDRVGDAAPECEHDAVFELDRRERRAIAARRVVAQVRRDRDRTGRREGGQQRPDDPRESRAAAGARGRARRRPRARGDARARPASISPGASKPLRRAVSSCSCAFTPRPPRRARRARAADAS